MDKLAVSILTTFMVAFLYGIQGKVFDLSDVYEGYDFEDGHEMQHVTTHETTTVLDNTVAKHGHQSLLWIWRVQKKLIINLEEQSMFLNDKRVCGLHFWVFQPIESEKHRMKITVFAANDQSYEFYTWMNFVQWRAVARVFRTPLKGINRVEFEVIGSDPFMMDGQVNIDVLRLASFCHGWAYDYINPPQMDLPDGKTNEIGGKENLNGRYTDGNFWQHLYKYKRIEDFFTPKINGKLPLTGEEDKLTKELRMIENRVDDWYFPEDQSIDALDSISKVRYNSLRDCETDLTNTPRSFKQWLKKLTSGNFPHVRGKMFYSNMATRDVCIKTAYGRLNELEESDSWPHLFPTRDIFPHGHKDLSGLKFNQINRLILFPLSLEYFISRRNKVRKSNIAKGLQSRSHMEQVLEPEVKYDIINDVKQAKNIFKAYRSIDNRRFRKLKKIFDYLKHEGWSSASSLGNTDHLINLNAGFTHSVYLLRKTLHKHGMLDQLLDTARWFNEIGELYLDEYTNNGSTADRIKNVMISRLLIVLASPYGSKYEARKKVHEARMLKRWIENALLINEGFGGLIKPDYTGFHHKGVYMSSYIPKALHGLSLVAYLLHGTAFALSGKALHNLKNSLMTYNIISSAYEVPHGVSGRHVSYGSPVVSSMVPAFAYLAIAMSPKPDTVEPELGSVFLSLYKREDPYLSMHLTDGRPHRGSDYFKGIGVISILDRAYKLAVTSGLHGASSLSGNWAKNFASLSIHRRDQWVVSVKGTSKYVWDYESAIDQNVLGRYQSHGQMQISNGRHSLNAYDIFSGWDWKKVPGTTTTDVDMNDLVTRTKSRYFSNSTFAGALTLGSNDAAIGMYSMHYVQPKYMDTFYKTNQHTFTSKKSYFYLEDMIVCVGSGITKSSLTDHRVMTTLFQNRLRGRASIYMDDKKLEKENNVVMRTNNSKHMTFLDVNNNGYFVPDLQNSTIDLKIGHNKGSMVPNGGQVRNLKSYGSVILDHGNEPKDAKYQYAVLVNSGYYGIRDFARTWQDAQEKPIEILQQDNIAHVVRMKRDGRTVTGYSIFDHEKFEKSTGFEIHKVSRPVMIMTEQVKNKLVVAIMDPDLRLFDEYKPFSRFIGVKELYSSVSQPAETVVTINGLCKITSKRNQKQSLQDSISDLHLVKSRDGLFRQQFRLLLSHGFTSELSLENV